MGTTQSTTSSPRKIRSQKSVSGTGSNSLLPASASTNDFSQEFPFKTSRLTLSKSTYVFSDSSHHLNNSNSKHENSHFNKEIMESSTSPYQSVDPATIATKQNSSSSTVGNFLRNNIINSIKFNRLSISSSAKKKSLSSGITGVTPSTSSIFANKLSEEVIADENDFMSHAGNKISRNSHDSGRSTSPHADANHIPSLMSHSISTYDSIQPSHHSNGFSSSFLRDKMWHSRNDSQGSKSTSTTTSGAGGGGGYHKFTARLSHFGEKSLHPHMHHHHSGRDDQEHHSSADPSSEMAALRKKELANLQSSFCPVNEPTSPKHKSKKFISKSTSCYTLSLNTRRELSSIGQQNENVITSCGHRRATVIQASTSELLKCLGHFFFHKCPQIEMLQPITCISWIRAVDRSLILQGWAEIAFINPANVVFLFSLVKDYVDENTSDERELQAIILTCLYLAYAYMGNEISYPLRPFLVESDRDVFWSRCLKIMNEKSAHMLRINADANFFTDMFTELKSYGQPQ